MCPGAGRDVCCWGSGIARAGQGARDAQGSQARRGSLRRNRLSEPGFLRKAAPACGRRRFGFIC